MGTYLNGLVLMSQDRAIWMKQTTALQNSKRKRNLRVACRARDLQRLDPENVIQISHDLILRIFQRVLKQNRHHCSPFSNKSKSIYQELKAKIEISDFELP